MGRLGVRVCPPPYFRVSVLNFNSHAKAHLALSQALSIVHLMRLPTKFTFLARILFNLINCLVNFYAAYL